MHLVAQGTPNENIPVKKIADGIWDIPLDTVITSGTNAASVRTASGSR